MNDQTEYEIDTAIAKYGLGDDDDDLPPDDLTAPRARALALLPPEPTGRCIDHLIENCPDCLPPDEPPDRAVSVPYLTASLRKPAAYLIGAIAALEAYPIATATPAERGDLLELRELLEAVNNAVRIRLGAIDMAFKRGMEELAAREIPVEGWGPVRYAPDEGVWEVRPDALLEDFRKLQSVGVVTQEDIDKAFSVVTTVTVDNRVLNGLQKRGTAVVDAIARNREKREGRPLAGRLTLPKRRRPAEEVERGDD